MRKISADYVFTGEGPLLAGTMLVVEKSGRVLDLVKDDRLDTEVERYEGILCPGFVNSHCHLELSHLKNKIPEGTGLDVFIRNVQGLRGHENEEILDAMEKAENEMLRNGIVAVGDISNTDISFKRKQEGNLWYHTFIEVLGFHPERADKAMEQGKNLYNKYTEIMGSSHSVSVTPHAPYSASVKLLHLVKEFAMQHGSILSIHNQESEEENIFFKFKEGKIAERIQYFGYDISSWQPTGLSSLKSTLVHLPVQNRLQLVHNTFTTAEDIAWASGYSGNLWWCFCPSANLYIESRLPDFSLFEGRNITVGTDSLASNSRLSVLEELKLIAAAIPGTPVEVLLRWATSSGAEYLGISSRFGYFKKGMKPGINLLTGSGSGRPVIDSTTEVKVLA